VTVKEEERLRKLRRISGHKREKEEHEKSYSSLSMLFAKYYCCQIKGVLDGRGM
jgi:hypothetical protein